MEFELVSTDVRISPRMRSFTERKTTKLAKILAGFYLPEDTTKARILVSRHPVKPFQISVTLPLPRRTLRAETAGDSFRSCLNEAVEKLSRQIKYYKAKQRHESSYNDLAEKKRSG